GRGVLPARRAASGGVRVLAGGGGVGAAAGDGPDAAAVAVRGRAGQEARAARADDDRHPGGGRGVPAHEHDRSRLLVRVARPSGGHRVRAGTVGGGGAADLDGAGQRRRPVRGHGERREQRGGAQRHAAGGGRAAAAGGADRGRLPGTRGVRRRVPPGDAGQRGGDGGGGADRGGRRQGERARPSEGEGLTADAVVEVGDQQFGLADGADVRQPRQQLLEHGAQL